MPRFVDLGRLLWLLGALEVGAVAGSLTAQEMDVPVDVQIPLLYKILTFDRHLGARPADEEIVVAVVFQASVRTSVLARDQIQAVLRQTTDSVAGRPVRWITLEIGAVPDLARAFEEHNVNVLYVAPLRGIDLGRITTASRRKQVVSFTGVSEYVERGIAIGIALERERPRISINLTAARAEGADFTAQLLKVANVVDGK